MNLYSLGRLQNFWKVKLQDVESFLQKKLKLPLVNATRYFVKWQNGKPQKYQRKIDGSGLCPRLHRLRIRIHEQHQQSQFYRNVWVLGVEQIRVISRLAALAASSLRKNLRIVEIINWPNPNFPLFAHKSFYTLACASDIVSMQFCGRWWDL